MVFSLPVRVQRSFDPTVGTVRRFMEKWTDIFDLIVIAVEGSDAVSADGSTCELVLAAIILR